MTFKLSVEIGSDAMQYGSDLALALVDVSAKVESLGILTEEDIYNRSGSLRDANGKAVGKWSIA